MGGWKGGGKEGRGGGRESWGHLARRRDEARKGIVVIYLVDNKKGEIRKVKDGR